MKETRLRLTPNEFGALWTYLNIRSNGFDDRCETMGFKNNIITVGGFIEENDIELIEEHNPDFRPQYEDGILTVDPLFRMWVSTIDSPATQRLMRAIQ